MEENITSRVISRNKTSNSIETDVLVIGAGLAGIMAAVSAAEAGARVCLASSGRTCSGSSFYPGTWGFGLVGPENEADEADLAETILSVGEGAADRELVRLFVSEINGSICKLEKMGVPLKKADNPNEREFIPCFDHKGRSWHGIVKEEARPVFLGRLEELGVLLLPWTEITELVQEEPRAGARGRVRGAVAVRDGRELLTIACKDTVIASGGLGGLYQYRLNPSDVTGMGQYLALTAGARLVNLEFMQMMPGFLSPAYGTVFNEKIFRYTRSDAYDGWSGEKRKELLELRSGHGPYTSRLQSRLVDEAIAAAWDRDPAGALICYDPELKANQPEFVRTYFEWLEKEKHLTVDDPVRVGIFAHASNGGIRIDPDGFAGVPGLYACGEAAGGMHGADRLGGLSTANGLVFGMRAGAAAARDAAQTAPENEAALKAAPDLIGMDGGIQAVRAVRRELQSRMSACAMISRSEQRCGQMLDWLGLQAGQIRQETPDEKDPALYLETRRLNAELSMADCMIQAIRLRKESRGSHHREDAPALDPGLTGKAIIISQGEDQKTFKAAFSSLHQNRSADVRPE